MEVLQEENAGGARSSGDGGGLASDFTPGTGFFTVSGFLAKFGVKIAEFAARRLGFRGE